VHNRTPIRCGRHRWPHLWQTRLLVPPFKWLSILIKQPGRRTHGTCCPQAHFLPSSVARCPGRPRPSTPSQLEHAIFDFREMISVHWMKHSGFAQNFALFHFQFLLQQRRSSCWSSLSLTDYLYASAYIEGDGGGRIEFTKQRALNVVAAAGCCATAGRSRSRPRPDLRQKLVSSDDMKPRLFVSNIAAKSPSQPRFAENFIRSAATTDS
jgi:hypothetical protein